MRKNPGRFSKEGRPVVRKAGEKLSAIYGSSLSATKSSVSEPGIFDSA